MTVGLVVEALALAPGDVLMSRGVGEVADLICAIDGGSYSHAGLWTGTRVIHATFDGIVCDALESSLEERQYVDVFRFSRDGAVLGAERWPADPVIASAASFVGGSYAYSDLLMLALLIGYGRRPGIPTLDSAVRHVGAHLAERLAVWLQSRVAARGDAPRAPAPMTCTELIGRAFYEAASIPPHAYALEAVLPGRGAAPQPPPAVHAPDLDVEYERVAEACRRALRQHAPAFDADEQMRAEDTPALPLAVLRFTHARRVIAGERALPLRTLTPRDLETSPTLSRVGRLSPPA